MVRKCKGFCFQTKNNRIFSNSPYGESSYCRECEVYVKQIKFDDCIVLEPPKEQYYDIEGKRKDVISLYKLKVRKIIDKIRCLCCGTQLRNKSHARNNILQKKKAKSEDSKTLKELGLKRAKRGISYKYCDACSAMSPHDRDAGCHDCYVLNKVA